VIKRPPGKPQAAKIKKPLGKPQAAVIKIAAWKATGGNQLIKPHRRQSINQTAQATIDQ